MQDVETRFWSKVDKSDGCWLWTAATNQKGYGQFGINGRGKKSHRVSYEWLVGPIPPGMHIDHICHVPACVNPAHLRVVTAKENNENKSGAYRSSRSGIRGVSWHKVARKWAVQVQHNGRNHYGGAFTDLAEAEAEAIALRERLFTHNDGDRK